MKNVALLIIFTLLYSCQEHKKNPTSFYLWKTVIHIDSTQFQELKSYECESLHIRFFDIYWDKTRKIAIPKAKATIVDTFLNHFYIIPVIFITNETMLSIDSININQLADSLFSLSKKMISNHTLKVKELQIDCDWSIKSRSNYFKLLDRLNVISTFKIIPTLRLHQVKYAAKTGIPPCSKTNLMYYNMGSLSGDPKAPNSIYNDEDAAKYYDYIKDYPLPLDISLPIFSWIIQTRHHKIVNVYAKIGLNDLKQKELFENIKPNIYRSKQDQFYKGVYFKQQDILKLESISNDELKDLSRILSKKVNKELVDKIIFYNFESINKNTIHETQFQKIITYFN